MDIRSENLEAFETLEAFPCANGLKIFSLKDHPDHLFSIKIREQISKIGKSSNNRLSSNYAKYNPWEDPSVYSFDVMVGENGIICFGALQYRPGFPKDTYRASSRYYLFPEYRSVVRRSQRHPNLQPNGFVGLLTNYQLQKAKNTLKARGVFISRDRAERAFKYLITNFINTWYGDSELKFQIIQEWKFNTCHGTRFDPCWQHVAAMSFTDTPPIDLMLEMPHQPL